MAKIWRASDTYEYSDFNRIESITRAAYSHFKNSMSLHKNIETITNRTIQSIFVVEDINRIEKNLKYVDFSGTFKQKEWEEGAAFSFEDANRWERVADLLQRAIVGVQAIRCGTHRCGTWPMYSVIGAVVKRTELYSTRLRSGTYEAIPCGTVPESSILGSSVAQEHIFELQGAAGTYAVDLCGTQPEYAIVGLVVKNTSTIEAGCAVAAFEVDASGENLCGTIPDQAQVGQAIQQIIQMGAAGSGATYSVKAAGMKYCGEEA